MSTLATPLRRQLESASKQAHRIADSGARHALEALAVHEPDPYRHMSEEQRLLRRKLRAQARQLGDGESRSKSGAYEIKHLAEKLAYDQWHRILFARFLLENDLLISPEHGVSVSMDDCEELASSIGLKDAWAVAARFAAQELPEIFKSDDPAGAVELSINDRKPLIDLVISLPKEVFTATDSLGWCYQFWQADKKDEVNAAGNKIGADELPSVTQLFTEDYMVDFLLDNTLGAWHAGKVLESKPELAATAKNEDELRAEMALPGCPWTYLRFVQTDGKWSPAAGTFNGWPKTTNQLKCLDPCMGSGHFVVSMFERLVALRVEEEGLDESLAIVAVIENNLYGLELDPRCTQIAAFNLALAAWRRRGHCALPAMNIACCGLAPNAKKDDWLKLVSADDRLQRGMARLYSLFKDAPELGSLINPRASSGDLLEAEFHELQPLLENVLLTESENFSTNEMIVAAKGISKAAQILTSKFTLVATNVPYLGRLKQNETLKKHCEHYYPEAKADLATCFVSRCIDFSLQGGTTILVTPNSWLFLDAYKNLRKNLLNSVEWNLLSRLGAGAFETIGGEVVNVILVSLTNQIPQTSDSIFCLDVSDEAQIFEKSRKLCSNKVIELIQEHQLDNPDSRINFEKSKISTYLHQYADSFKGLDTGDLPRFIFNFWEIIDFDKWSFFSDAPLSTELYTGLNQVLRWDNATGDLSKFENANIRGRSAWGKIGINVAQMGELPCSLYAGTLYGVNSSVLIPKAAEYLSSIWLYCSSPEFKNEIRKIDQSLKVTNSALVKVPFDFPYWNEIAKKKLPDGLPKPFTTDSRQCIFSGNPLGSDQPLHVAVARLLGYKWPLQLGATYPNCSALSPDGLDSFVDNEGIVCLSASNGKASGAERLRVLLSMAIDNFDVANLLSTAGLSGSKSDSIESWLRDEFFDQHCALFLQRPFIWHIWDGHKSGFSALINSHKFDYDKLQTLTYSYLGDWIRKQQASVEAGESGSDARLSAARNLQNQLKLILDGEPPFDIFVRWKPLSQQAVGWHPDINDGVRMNIRPFLAEDIPGGKKGAGILRSKPNIKWEKDRGKEPVRDKKEFPWFWSWDGAKQDFEGLGKEPDGNRWNDLHYSNEIKNKARAAGKAR